MAAREIGGPPPAERRFLGLDRRNIGPALAVLALILFWSAVIPAIDAAIDADEVPEGTVYTLSRGVEFTPAPGWSLSGVALPSAPSITLYRGGVTFDIRAGAFSGTPAELLEVISDTSNDLKLEGGIFPLALVGGLSGAASQMFGTNYSGDLFAIVGPGPGGSRDTGIQVTVTGPPDILPRYDDQVKAMIESIRIAGEGSTP